MFPITRLFESEEAARAVIEQLVAGEEPRERSMVISPTDPDAAGKVDAAIEAGTIMKGHRRALMEALQRGRTILTSRPSDLTTGKFVETTLEASAVDPGAIEDYVPANPAPFSELLGIPVLLESKSETGLFKFDKDSSFGLKLISHNATPLSSLLRLPLLRKHKSARGTSIERLSGKPAMLSPMLGMPLLTKKHKSARGTAVERMSGNAAPLSKFLGLRVLSKRR